MKFCFAVLMTALLLSGCGAEETFETVADELAMPAMAPAKTIVVELPGETALPVAENDSGRIYICNDYEILLQTVESGDIGATVEAMSGFSADALTVLETARDGMDRYEFVWASAGEGGDRLGRGVILDDGSYHYTMAVLRSADSEADRQISWDAVFSSFTVSDGAEDQY